MRAHLKKLVTIVLFCSFLTSLSFANNFNEAIEDFENGRFRESARKLVLLANQGDLFAQTYVTWMMKSNKDLFSPGEISFQVLESSCMRMPEESLKASLLKFVFCGQEKKEAGFSNLPSSKKRALQELEALFKNGNPQAYIVMGDLRGKGIEFPFLKKQNDKKDYYGEAARKGNFTGFLRLKALEVHSQFMEEVLSVVGTLGLSPQQKDIYFALFNHFKERTLRKEFCYMAAYHGHREAQFALTQERYIQTQEQGDFWIEQAARLGHPKAVGQLGYIYEQRKDFEGAFDLYSKASLQEEADSVIFYNLGVFYCDGRGTVVNLEKALENFRKAYAKMTPQQPFQITDLDIFHRTVNVLLKMGKPEALEWLKAGIQQKDVTSVIDYAICFFNGNLEEENPQKALETLRLLSSSEHTPKSLEMLSYLLISRKFEASPNEWSLVEEFLIKNYKPKKGAASHLEEQSFDPDLACYMLSVLYSTGKNGTVEPDYKKALLFLEPALQRGDPLAFFQKGQLHEFGVEKNDRKAFDSYLKATQLGYDCWNHLGAYYMNGGEGVSQDDKEAISCFEKAMENDENGIAHYNYALMMRDQRGGLVFDEKSWISLLEKSISLGYFHAWKELGLHFLKKEDLGRAKLCFEEGNKTGDRDSFYNLIFLNCQQPQEEKDRLQHLKKLEDFTQDEQNSDVLFKTGLLFILNQDLDPKYLEKGHSYLERAIHFGSTEAQYLKDILKNEAALRAQVEAQKTETSSAHEGAFAVGIPHEEAGAVGASTSEDHLLEQESYEFNEEESSVGGASLKEHSKKDKGEGSQKKRIVSKKMQEILDFLDPKSPRQVSVHKVFSMIGDLIREKGGSFMRSKKGIRVEIGSDRIYTHLQHGKRGGGHQSELDGARLSEIKNFFEKVINSPSTNKD
ncbi:MAG: hypothetical protein B7Y25_02450 [Alphaproteobacteria bacterium 16-39-46]|nr:MAG: hypothetical protein B7Y25_02450 [Alphaproteobacteria bacterium 16-39-46]OZA43614.1 MAG: hypothetical protein B7X84_02565 [Alphaproteobacteria bacterium 17-39-52]HQS83773.1 tetratricopeptide repeat protein [Alphaproteobacteria bacterium]HQS93596.1 tetratricopeptide repeat protein [Alphaproteobacteria bacterium]